MAVPTMDLTKHAPRSPRVRLGGYAILPRLLDKGRAALAGKNGDYNYGCPLDQRFLEFASIDAKSLKKQLAAGKGDGEILKWVKSHAEPLRTECEIEAWSAWQERRTPDNPDSRKFFNRIHQDVAPERTDITSWFDLLDMDDYASYGGKV